ncbi:MAG TPA: UDP-N-acetylmuramoyl-tripeptide--D-alanyl-D-alanine ligase [Candidatus Paceibacterota bacterium]|nr:UDP-N-acetylmuramoyl-tripeptide--D-alanyl-D-alanine ligase [Candidatus Paceibacterota bacterium]
MKSSLRSMFASLLALLARGVVRKYRPKIVMVTGSVGKTSTKDAVAAALAEQFFVRKSEKSYNSEFGMPFTILGAKNPWENPLAWLKLFGEALLLRFTPNVYPSVLVLEVGADRPGDIEKMLRIALPDAVVVTRLPEIPVHVEAYATPAAVREEEFYPAYALDAGMPLIMNAEDTFATSMSARLTARVISFGTSASATARITDAHLHIEGGRVLGMQAVLHIGREECALEAPGVVGTPALYAPAAAIATATALGMSLKDACTGVAAYQPPPGRARILEGKGGAVLIDDSYNSSPAATEEALASLNLIADELKLRRIAVLGDMLELGRYSHEEHARIGELAAQRADVLVAVGIRARGIADAAKAAGMPVGNVRMYGTSEEAAGALKELAGAGDVVLIKGSQSIRTERIVEALLANPEDSALLVRQDSEWKKR